MSFSVSAQRAKKEDVVAAIGAELDKVVESQPVHAADIDHAKTTTENYVGLMAESDTKDIYCSVSGSIWKTEEEGVKQVSISISLTQVERSGQSAG